MSNPRDERAASRDQRKHLQIQANYRERVRSRSPSPAPQSVPLPSSPGAPTASSQPKRSSSEIQDDQFRDALAYPAAMATPEQLASIRQQLRDELRIEVRNEFRNETAAAAASIPDSIRKKPEIPAFDKTHVEIWIKRMENAFIRANIRRVDEKFAFLETKFPVGQDPAIDEYLYGNATDAAWVSFTTYLKKEYGTTIQQRASIFVDGFKREGRRPSQYAAALDDKTKDVTVDDIKKEMLLREMPTDVRRMMQERVEKLSFKDAAKVADNYFDSEGRPKHGNQNPTVSHVSRSTPKPSFPESAETTDEEDTDVNSAGYRKKRFDRRPNNRTQQSRNIAPQQQAQGKQTQQPQNRDSRTPPSQKQNQLCRYHNLYGDEAQTCRKGCPKFPKVLSNGKAGRQT